MVQVRAVASPREFPSLNDGYSSVMEKKCISCGTKNGVYGKDTRCLDGMKRKCKPCESKYHKEHRRSNKQKYSRRSADYHRRTREERLHYAKMARLKFRTAVLAHFGAICNCPGCGVTEEKFLGIDHIHGNGGKHRKEIGARTIYKWLVKNNFPEGFQVLCHNCNQAKGVYGECPHVTAQVHANDELDEETQFQRENHKVLSESL